MTTTIKMTNVQFIDNKGVGMLIQGDGFDIQMVDTVFAGNTVAGLAVQDSASALIRQLSLPEGIDRAELAELLRSLAESSEGERLEVASSSRFVGFMAKAGLDASTLAANLVTVSGLPIIQKIIEVLTG